MQDARCGVISYFQINLQNSELEYCNYRCQKIDRLIAFCNVSSSASVVLSCTKLIICLIVKDNQNISLFE